MNRAPIPVIGGPQIQRTLIVVGVYPVGSVVELNTGEIAVVRRVHRGSPLEPVVIVVRNAGKTALSRPEEQDLRRQTRLPHRRIISVKDPQRAGLDPSAYLDEKSR